MIHEILIKHKAEYILRAAGVQQPKGRHHRTFACLCREVTAKYAPLVTQPTTNLLGGPLRAPPRLHALRPAPRVTRFRVKAP